jgi:hypothetical protein
MLRIPQALNMKYLKFIFACSAIWFMANFAANTLGTSNASYESCSTTGPWSWGCD